MKNQKFTTDVMLAGINPYVDASKQVVKTLGGELRAALLVKYVKVDPSKGEQTVSPEIRKLEADAASLKTTGRLAPGGWFRTTLVPIRSKSTRQHLDTWMREAAGAGVGDRVRVRIIPDRAPRDLPIQAGLDEEIYTTA